MNILIAMLCIMYVGWISPDCIHNIELHNTDGIEILTGQSYPRTFDTSFSPETGFLVDMKETRLCGVGGEI